MSLKLNEMKKVSPKSLRSSLDVEWEVTRKLGKQIADSIDREILETLKNRRVPLKVGGSVWLG